MIKIASLFSGIGGFEKGLLQAMPDAKIVFSSEIDKYARQIYNKNYGVEPYGDITKIKASSIPDHDILCGGFPCQTFSIAGKRRGFEDTRGTLFFEIMRIAKVKRPKLLYLENVRGLLSHEGGRTFQTILRSMDDMGYDAEWQVFNSKNHGVPQNRERVFIIGHLRGAGTRQIFPITDSIKPIPEKRDGNSISTGCISTRNQSGQAQWDGSTTLIANGVNNKSSGAEIRNDGIASSIKSQSGSQTPTVFICDSGPGRKDQLRSETIPPLRANTGAGHNNIVCHSTLPRSSTSGHGGTGHLQREDGLSYCCDANNNVAIEIPNLAGCLTGGGHSGGNHSDMTVLKKGSKIRRLTPIECERLQGFPDNWTEGISDTQRYKCLGNAVTVNVIEFISHHIKEMLQHKDA